MKRNDVCPSVCPSKGPQQQTCPVWARGRCRISPSRFLAECHKRRLNQGSFVLLYFSLFTFSDLYWVRVCVFSCTVLFVSISQVIGCEDRLESDLYCVGWGVKLYSIQCSSGFAAVGLAGRRYRSTVVAADECGQCHVVSVRRKLNTDLLVL